MGGWSSLVPRLAFDSCELGRGPVVSVSQRQHVPFLSNMKVRHPMPNTNSVAARITRIGKADRDALTIANDVFAATADTYDWSARGAVPKAIDAYVGGFGPVPAKSKGPKGAQTSTDYGRGVDAVRQHLSKIVKGDAPKTVALRATLSGEGGGSVVVDMDSDLGRALIALIRADQD